MPAQHLDASNFQSTLDSAQTPVLVDFFAQWCGPCQMVGPMLEQLAAEWAGHIKIGKLDMDQNPMTPSRFAVQSVPTLLFFNGGQLVQTLIGAQSKAAIVKVLRSLVAG